MFKRWLYHPAEWWEFWYPQSGYKGGGMIGAAMFIAALLLVGLFDR